MKQREGEELIPGDEPLEALADLTTPEEKELTRIHDPYLALRFRDFWLLQIGLGFAWLGEQMMTVAIGWELYNRTGSALALGFVGLAQIIPVILLFLPAGYIADRYSRKQVVIVSQLAAAVSSLGLVLLSAQSGPLLLIYACLMVIGGAQAFSGPASSALVSEVIPEEAYENAMTWRNSMVQVSSVVGPAAGGFLIALLHGATWVYALNMGFALIFVVMLLLLHARKQVRTTIIQRTPGSVLGGLRFLGQTQVLLAAITLDLFAVLLGGATTLLPIFAKNILHVGPTGLGVLQSASSVGAILMALFLTRRPPFKHAGRTLLLAVAGFGLATVIFGLSHMFWLSFMMLFVLGALDSISMIIRSTLVLLRTPNEMRGRVGAVNSLFIGTSNELGGFESGLVAQFFGPVISVVAGGIGTVLVVILVASLWPEMRNLGSIRAPSTNPDKQANNELQGNALRRI